MLKILTDNAPDVSPETPFGCRIASAAATYGQSGPFEQFWVQDGGTVLAKIDDIALIEEKDGMDAEEVLAFLRTLDVKKFSCSEETAKHLGLAPSAWGEIMVLHAQNHKEEAYADVRFDPSPREIYSVLKQSETNTFRVPEFEPFYMDLSYRTRHGAALSAGVYQGARLVSCAVCTAMTERAAVISAVACVPGLRRHGYGRTAVNALAGRLKRENIYIFRAEGENEEFYRSLGFESYGRWVEVDFQNT
ncbi:MAG: N-acetyltransferase domain-containing protein [Thermocaproicibacter melissae]|jgi:GNAT superfamily N-acetyltransferase|uniref:GNAT family N-acetyltransferase n=1 Tax=Thermocaproicibacter melissae TaxID=2966552 RepID=UPI0024B22B40|nr:GNAT family N-acetyltransferase [Thermocaproicibacter melissae]WBY63819.1 GNAT family N-acetyltransferase [Thermocaproicibacter melissae]